MKIDKKYTDSIICMGEDDVFEIKRHKTNLPSLDTLIGGGLPCGKVVELSGTESSGKTSFALQIASNFTKQGKDVLYVDYEHSINLELFKQRGGNSKHLYVCQPDSAEQGIDMMVEMLSTNDISLLVVDSIAEMSPMAEIQNSAENSNMGKTAQLIGKMFRLLKPIISAKETYSIFINQNRRKIGVFFGSPEYTVGGNAVKYMPSLRVKIKSVNKDDYGYMCNFKVIKNKYGKPGVDTNVRFDYGIGFNVSSSLIEDMLDREIIVRNGSHYKISGIDRSFAGIKTLTKYVDDNFEEVQKIYDNKISTN